MYRYYGREEELRFLVNLLNKRNSFTIIYGPKGSGKSAILRQFHFFLLKKTEVVVGYTKVYKGRDPFSYLFGYLLVSAYNNLVRKGDKKELSSFFSSLKMHLEELRRLKGGRLLLFNIKGVLLQGKFQDLLKSSRPLWNEFKLEEVMQDFLHALQEEHILSFIKGVSAALKERKILLIIDDADSIVEEYCSLVDDLVKVPNLHLLLSMEEGAVEKTGLKSRKGVNLLKIGPLSENGIKRWLKREVPHLGKSIKDEEIAKLSKISVFTISEWIKQGAKREDLRWDSFKEGIGFVDRIFQAYDYSTKRLITKIALMRYPLSIPEYARLFEMEEEGTRRYFMRFEDDFLISRVYLENKDVFFCEHPIKQERIIELAKEYFNLDELYKEIASFFEREISYPTEEGGFRFWGNLRNALYYYGKVKGKGSNLAKDFYEKAFYLFAKGKGNILTLVNHLYFKELKIKLKIIIYALLAEKEKENPDGFRKTLSKLTQFASERKEFLDFQIEYGKALFYLCSRLGAEKRFKEVDLVVERFSFLIYEHEDIKELRLIFATMLFNLSYDFAAVQRFERMKRILEMMDHLLHRNPEEVRLRLLYIKIISILCHKMGERGKFKELLDYLDKQASILRMGRSSDEAKLEYAKTLCNASFYLAKGRRFKDIEWVLDRLRRLEGENPGLTEIRCEYAKALSNVSSLYSEAEEFEKSTKFIEALGALVVKEEVEGVDKAYVLSLFNLSSDLGRAKKFDILDGYLDKMRELAFKTPTNEEIVIIYARALYNVSYELGEKGIFDLLFSNLTQLIKLFRKIPHPEVEVLCFRTIFNVTEDLIKRKRTKDTLRMLSMIERVMEKRFRHPQTRKLLTQTLFNLTSYLSKNLETESLQKSLSFLKEVATKGEVNLYLDALLNAVAYIGMGGKVKEASQILDELERLSKEEKGASLVYIKALADITNIYGEKALFEEIDKVIKKAENVFEENPLIKEPFMDLLVNACVHFAKKEDLKALESVIEKLKKIYHQGSPEDEGVGIAYTKALILLYNEWEKKEDLERMGKVAAILEEIAESNPAVMSFLETIEFPLY